MPAALANASSWETGMLASKPMYMRKLPTVRLKQLLLEVAAVATVHICVKDTQKTFVEEGTARVVPSTPL